MSDIFVGRQPIFDRNQDVFAYELLFRDGDASSARIAPGAGDQATSEVLIHTVLDIGTAHLMNGLPAFVNLGRGFLAGDHPLPLSPNELVIEVLEDVPPEPAVLDSLKRFSEQGYWIALDDFHYREELRPFLDLADILKLDIQALSQRALEQHVRLAQLTGKQLLAEKVETYEELEQCRALGFDYFQGYFLCRPHLVRGRGQTSNRAVVVELLARMQDPAVTPEQLEQSIARDPALSYRLMRYVNSPLYGLRTEVDSLQQAVLLLGLETIRRWASLILLSRIDDKPEELLTTGLVRAKMSELLAPRPLRSSAFTVGLLSILDALMDRPLSELMEGLPLTQEIKSALLDHAGPIGAILTEVCDYERGAWTHLPTASGEPDIYRSAYLEALDWSRESMRALEAK